MVIVSVNFDVSDERASELERTWRTVFMPAIAAWPGFLGCELLRDWPWNGAADTNRRYRMDLRFDHEDHRVAWADSAEHAKAFGALEAIAEHRGERFVPMAVHGV